MGLDYKKLIQVHLFIKSRHRGRHRYKSGEQTMSFVYWKEM